jgi:glycosyltransferase involved in cell wall biosynthesis
MSQFFIGLSLKKTAAIIAETENLKWQIIHRWKKTEGKIKIVDLGVDARLFKPLNKGIARNKIRISDNAIVMLYVGVADSSHDISSVLEAMSKIEVAGLELHIVGNGELLPHYQRLAQNIPNKIVFHGYVSHKDIPIYISAADICLAMYNLNNFTAAEVPYSMLKIHEYLSCGRPVAGVRCNRLRELVTPGKTGILLDSTEAAWVNFLNNFPSLKELNTMAENVQTSYVPQSWEQTADDYLDICWEVLGI